jgi:2-polyprenyl-6-methoxyphenol hydroxylase-like FAD-dependent oxidoreductase
MRRFVIVGGGATGTAAALALHRHGLAGLVDIVDPNPPGRGIVFDTTGSTLLCNTSVGVMSLHADRPHDFLDYLHRRGLPATLADFVPRRLVSEYCVDAIAGLARHVRARAVAVMVDADRYRVVLHDGSSIPADDVIVCTGTGPPLVPCSLRRHVGRPGLFTSLYPTDALLAALRAGSRVLILGTRLSAIDAALVLTAHGHRVVLASRSGELPAVRTRVYHTGRAPLDHAAFARLDPRDPALPRQVLSLIRRATGPLVTSLAADPLERLRQETALAIAGRIPWQDTIAELIDLINMSTMDHWDAALTSCRHLIARYVSAFPLANAQRLLAAIDNGSVTLAPPAPLRIEPHAGTWQATWPSAVERFDAVVCATGYQPPLLAARPGVLRLDTRGVAPDLDHSLRLLGGPTPERIWLLGTTSHPRVPITNYLRTAVTQAAALARTVAAYPSQQAA